MIRDFNLLATADNYNRSQACSELWMLLRAVGDETPSVDRSPVKGLITARTSLDPQEAIRRLREELHVNRDHFKVLLRVMPIEVRVQTTLEEIKEASRRLASKIPEDDAYRITVEKRRTDLRSMEVIDAVAEGIERRVDLENPDWVLLIQIIGRTTGISVIPPDGLLNVQKERAALPAKGQ